MNTKIYTKITMYFFCGRCAYLVILVVTSASRNTVNGRLMK